MEDALDTYTTFTVDFGQDSSGGVTSETVREAVLLHATNNHPYSLLFQGRSLTRETDHILITRSHIQPDGDTGYETLFRKLSQAFPQVRFEVSGWGTDVDDAWTNTYIAGESQFRTASVMTPNYVQILPEHPVCPACGFRGEHTIYFRPHIFRGTLNPDGSVTHHGLVGDGDPDPQLVCGECEYEMPNSRTLIR